MKDVGWMWVLSIVGGCLGGKEASRTQADECSGTYTCEYPGDSYDLELVREGDECTAGKLVLRADGAVSTADEPNFGSYEWSGDRSEFTLCDGEEGCVTCHSEGGVDEGAEEGTSCRGSPTTCSSLSPGSCSSVSGCYLHTHYRYGGRTDESCAGSPHSCSGIYSADRCERQGCYWE